MLSKTTIAFVVSILLAGIVISNLYQRLNKTVKQRLMVEAVNIEIPQKSHFIDHYGNVLFSDSVSSSLEFDKDQFEYLVKSIETSPYFNDTTVLTHPEKVHGQNGIWLRHGRQYEFVRLYDYRQKITVYPENKLLTVVTY